jgi:hypothetical protein
MRTMKPGDFGFRDAEYAVTQSAKIKRLVHAWFRAQVRGKHHIPDRNFIAVGNHSGGTLMPDMLVWLSDYISAQTSPIPYCLNTIPSALPGRWQGWAQSAPIHA